MLSPGQVSSSDGSQRAARVRMRNRSHSHLSLLVRWRRRLEDVKVGGHFPVSVLLRPPTVDRYETPATVTRWPWPGIGLELPSPSSL